MTKIQFYIHFHLHANKLDFFFGVIKKTHICLWHTMHNQSVRFVNSRHPLHTRNLQARHGAPRFNIRPKSLRQRAHERFESMIIGRSKLPVLRALRFFKLWSSARKSLYTIIIIIIFFCLCHFRVAPTKYYFSFHCVMEMDFFFIFRYFFFILYVTEVT